LIGGTLSFTEQSVGYDPKADFRGAQTGIWEADLQYGLLGENFTASILESIVNGSIEVKSDSYENGNIFIELAHCPNRNTDSNGNFVWVKSGLNVTEAKYYFYLKLSKAGEFRSGLILSTQRLNAFRQLWKQENGTDILPKGSKGTGYMIGNENGQIPTLGLRIASPEINLLTHKQKWDTE
jgi:hypothetical protein